MEKRRLDDLWAYDKFSRAVKEEHGLDPRSHIRYLEDRRGCCVVLVVKKSSYSWAIDEGNFNWLVNLQRRNRVDQTYVALVEDWDNGEIINYDTALNVDSRLRNVPPNNGDDGGTYWWVDENFTPSGGTGGVLSRGRTLTKSPF
jgi:hypothetical protein